ncbi:MAG: hypothetical protein ACRDO9_07785, partial [Gaiellales bacterium]
MSRLPIRVRLSLAFAVAMAVVLAALGAFLYFQLRHSLDEQIEASLRAQADAAAAGAVVQREESLAQVLDANGQVIHGLDRPLAEPTTREHFVDREVAGLDDNPYRLLVVPGEGGQTVVV